MAATVACRDAGEDFAIHARSFSGEHFLSLTTGLVPGQECVLFLVGGSDRGCFRHQLLLPRPYLVLTKPLRLDIQCQRAASVKIGWKYLDD